MNDDRRKLAEAYKDAIGHQVVRDLARTLLAAEADLALAREALEKIATERFTDVTYIPTAALDSRELARDTLTRITKGHHD